VAIGHSYQNFVAFAGDNIVHEIADDGGGFRIQVRTPSR
jgi:hypothetical protein